MAATFKSLPDFQREFPDEGACARYLLDVKFPSGWVCPKCGDQGKPRRVTSRPRILRCRADHRHELSLTAGTVMHRTKLPVCMWFWGAYLVTHGPPGMSALQFQKWLGIKRYETAFQLLHKLRAGMVNPKRTPVGQQYPVEVDETFVGGATQGEGKGVHHKTLVVGAVEVMPRRSVKWTGKDPNLIVGTAETKHRGGHGRGIVAGRLRLQIAPNRSRDALLPFVQVNVAPGAEVRTDGWIGYDRLGKLGYVHEAVSIRGDHVTTGQHLPMIHIVFGNLDAWLLGTHHGVSPQHLQAYLNEFVFRFNRRFWPGAAFDAVLRLGTGVRAPTYAGLYRRTWSHPGSYGPTG